jgi:hypothetical protein
MISLRLSAALAAFTLAGCPTVDLGENPPDPGRCRPDFAYYRDIIWPEFLAPTEPARSCVDAAGCHQRDNGRSALRLVVNEPIDHNSNYQVVTRFLNCGTPEASSLLTKPLTGLDPHGGGDLFDASDPAYDVFLLWFTQ